MKSLLPLFTASLLVLLISCSKDDVKLTPLSSLIITNAVIGTSELKLGSNMLSTPYNSFSEYGLIAGPNNLYVWPGGDSSHPIYNQPLKTKNGHIYTLFLAGEVGGTIDPILVEEDLPIHTDSTCGIRFINLAPGGPHVSIMLTGGNHHEFSDLEYKEKSWFLMYPAKLENSQYEFEVVDNATGNLLTSYSLSTPRFKNVTLAFTGDATVGYSIVQVNHY